MFLNLYNEAIYRPLLNLLVFFYKVIPGHDIGVVIILRSSTNTFNNITISEDMFSACNSFASTTRLGTSPLTNALLVDDTKYYFKIRSYRDWTNTTSTTAYNEGKIQSATPYLGSNKFHPHQFGVVCINPYSNN